MKLVSTGRRIKVELDSGICRDAQILLTGKTPLGDNVYLLEVFGIDKRFVILYDDNKFVSNANLEPTFFRFRLEVLSKSIRG